MDWEAVLVIGGFAAALGVLLGAPALWWARRRVRMNPAAPGSRKLRKGELVTIATLVSVMFVPLTARFWAADTWLGQWVSTDFGALSYLFLFWLGITALGFLIVLAVFLLRRWR